MDPRGGPRAGMGIDFGGGRGQLAGPLCWGMAGGVLGKRVPPWAAGLGRVGVVLIL